MTMFGKDEQQFEVYYMGAEACSVVERRDISSWVWVVAVVRPWICGPSLGGNVVSSESRNPLH